MSNKHYIRLLGIVIILYWVTYNPSLYSAPFNPSSQGGIGITASTKLSFDTSLESGQTALSLASAIESKNGIDETTGLIAAANKGQLELVKLILDRGVNPNAKHRKGTTALIVASQSDHMEIVKLLLNRGADTDYRGTDRTTALIEASKRGHFEIAELLLNEGANVNAGDIYSNAALLYASNKGYLKIVKLLLNKGADINDRSRSGTTALIVASHLGHKEMVGLLLASGADVNAKDRSGKTALIEASERGHLEIARILLENGAINTILIRGVLIISLTIIGGIVLILLNVLLEFSYNRKLSPSLELGVTNVYSSSAKKILCWLAIVIIGFQNAFLAFFILGCLLDLLLSAQVSGEAGGALYLILRSYLGVTIATIVGVCAGGFSYRIYTSLINRLKWVRVLTITGLVELGIMSAIILNYYGYISPLEPRFVRMILRIF